MTGAELRQLFSDVPDEADVDIVIELTPDGPLWSIWFENKCQMSVLGEHVKLTQSLRALLQQMPEAFWYRLGREDAETEHQLQQRVSDLRRLFSTNGHAKSA